jgi:Protein of unknown function (DUF1194)
VRRLAATAGVAAILCGGLVARSVGAAPDARVDLDLVLAVDSSSSVDGEEFALQMEGLAHAFRDPALVAAIEAGQHRAIAVSLIEWSNATWQRENVGWTAIHDTASAHAFADRIEAAPRLIYGGATSISGALRFALKQLGGGAPPAERTVIDLSGDGSNNQGAPVAEARQAVLAAGITINGLAIVNEEPDLEQYYRTEVIGGSGAVALAARDYEDFSRAILRKLLREIEAVPVAAAPAQIQTGQIQTAQIKTGRNQTAQHQTALSHF